MEAAAREEERQSEARRKEIRRDIQKETGRMRKVLQAEMRRDKLKTQEREKNRMREKQLIRAAARKSNAALLDA
jgi:hypothetical protein